MEKNVDSTGNSSPQPSLDMLLSEGMNLGCNLTNDLIAKIFLCLPVKPLMRFKCVAKPWCSLIESTQFAKMHLDRSVERETNFGMILRGSGFYLVDFSSLEDGTGAATEINDDPLQIEMSGSAIVGTCNGIVAVFDTFGDVILCNPSIRQVKRLPNPRINLPHPNHLMTTPLCGFGYDHLSDDYKVVRIIPAYGNPSGSRVFIFSLKKNSWKQIKSIPFQVFFKETWGVFVSGAMHWLGKWVQNSGPSVLAFNLGAESCGELALPKFEVGTYIDLVAFGGCLSVLAFYPRDHIDVFVMKEYGVAKSWSKLFSVKQPEVITSFDYLKPLAYSRSGKAVLLEVDNKKIMWFDLEGKKVENVEICELPELFDAEVYTESLFKLDDQKSIGKKKEKMKQRGKKDM